MGDLLIDARRGAYLGQEVLALLRGELLLVVVLQQVRLTVLPKRFPNFIDIVLVVARVGMALRRRSRRVPPYMLTSMLSMSVPVRARTKEWSKPQNNRENLPSPAKNHGNRFVFGAYLCRPCEFSVDLWIYSADDAVNNVVIGFHSIQ